MVGRKKITDYAYDKEAMDSAKYDAMKTILDANEFAILAKTPEGIKIQVAASQLTQASFLLAFLDACEPLVE